MANNPALEYRQQAVNGASSIGLVVLLYEAGLNSLNRAIRAIDAGNIEQRCDALNHVLAVLAQLQRSLNFNEGGDVAKSLDRFYDACRATVMEATVTQSKDPLVKLIAQMQGIRDAWKQADRQENPIPAAASRPSIPPVSSYAPALSGSSSFSSGERWSA